MNRSVVRSEWLVGVLVTLVAACGGSSKASTSDSQANSPSAKPDAASARNAVASTDPAPKSAHAPAPKAPAPKAAASGKPPASAPAQAAPPAAPSKAPLISIIDLRDRRDLWPTKVKLTKKVGYSPTEVYNPGLELDLVEIAAGQVHLDTGNGLIEVPAASTDILERASNLMASLSPEQLAVTAKTLPSHPELWPVELSVVRPLSFANGSSVPAGRTVILRAFEGEQVNVYDRTLRTYFPAAINETDIVARARERVKLDAKDRTPFFVRSIAAALESSGGAPAVEKSDYVLVYEARLGCGRCAQFLPELTKFYERMKPDHPGFEAVFVSNDFTADDAKKLEEREKLPGQAVAYDRRLEAADLGTKTQNGDLLPLVYVYDRTGKLVTRNAANGGKPSASDVLATLEKKLGEKK
ncbi:MAG TPA: thioredoxin-like domain-containing protein [Planctomycetota bacterium]|nr:thioredoxin-like domain-containing protein [Planctomycetota bacterium]